MPEEDPRPAGLTKDAGWQIGVRSTLSMPCNEVWYLLTSPSGLRIWLDPVSGMDQAIGATYQLEGGTRDEVRVITPHSHLRLAWQP